MQQAIDKQQNVTLTSVIFILGTLVLSCVTALTYAAIAMERHGLQPDEVSYLMLPTILWIWFLTSIVAWIAYELSGGRIDLLDLGGHIEHQGLSDEMQAPTEADTKDSKLTVLALALVLMLGGSGLAMAIAFYFFDYSKAWELGAVVILASVVISGLALVLEKFYRSFRS